VFNKDNTIIDKEIKKVKDEDKTFDVDEDSNTNKQKKLNL
jgi:hypothetical protein